MQVEFDRDTYLYRQNGKVIRVLLTDQGTAYFLEGIAIRDAMLLQNVSSLPPNYSTREPPTIETSIRGIVPSRGSRRGYLAYVTDTGAFRKERATAFFREDGSITTPDGTVLKDGMTWDAKEPRCLGDQPIQFTKGGFWKSPGFTYGGVPIIGAITETRCLVFEKIGLPQQYQIKSIARISSSLFLRGAIYGHPTVRNGDNYRSKPVQALLLANGGIVTPSGFAIPEPAPWFCQPIPLKGSTGKTSVYIPTNWLGTPGSPRPAKPAHAEPL